MHYASPETTPAPQVIRIRPVAGGVSRRVEAELHRLLDHPGVAPGRVRNALVMALLHPLHRCLLAPCSGATRLGVVRGPHRLLRLRGVRVMLPAKGTGLDPAQVTVTHRSAFGGVRVTPGVRFGGPEVEASALAHGLDPVLLREIVRVAQGAATREGRLDWLSPMLLWTAGGG